MQIEIVRLTCFIAGFFSCILSGCGWERKLVFRGPSDNTSVEIQQPFPANGWGIRVLLDRNGRKKTLYQIRGDVFLDFADVEWAKDSENVAVFTCGTPPVRLAYDMTGNEFVPFSQMADRLAGHIRTKYHLTDRNNSHQSTFEWACSEEGKHSFLLAFPDATPR